MQNIHRKLEMMMSSVRYACDLFIIKWFIPPENTNMLNSMYEQPNKQPMEWEMDGGAKMASLNLKYEFIAFILLILERIWNSYVYLYDSSRFTIFYSNRNVFSSDFRFGNLFGQMMMRLCATGFDLPRFTYISRVFARSFTGIS